MRASIDWDECAGHGTCARVAPEVFSVDADGNSDVLLDEIPENLRAKAMLAMRQCPTNAISVWEEEAAAS
jgi:ferredoxin